MPFERTGRDRVLHKRETLPERRHRPPTGPQRSRLRHPYVDASVAGRHRCTDPNDPSVLFGARPEPGDQQGTTTLETQAGRRLGAIRVYYNWDSPFPDADVNWFVANRYPLLLSVKSERVNHTFVQWRDIANAQPGSARYNNIVWNSLEKLLNPMRLFAQGHAIKGLMVPEYASTEDPAQPNRKAQWLSDARALFKKAGWEGFRAVLYYNYNKSSEFPNCRWFVNSSQASLNAFRAMGADVYYTRFE